MLIEITHKIHIRIIAIALMVCGFFSINAQQEENINLTLKEKLFNKKNFSFELAFAHPFTLDKETRNADEIFDEYIERVINRRFNIEPPLGSTLGFSEDLSLMNLVNGHYFFPISNKFSLGMGLSVAYIHHRMSADEEVKNNLEYLRARFVEENPSGPQNYQSYQRYLDYSWSTETRKVTHHLNGFLSLRAKYDLYDKFTIYSSVYFMFLESYNNMNNFMTTHPIRRNALHMISRYLYYDLFVGREIYSSESGSFQANIGLYNTDHKINFQALSIRLGISFQPN